MNWHKIVELLGTEWGGMKTCPPGDQLRFQGIEFPPVVHTSEDGFTLWMGTADEWMCHMSRRDARRLAWWILVRWWCIGEWFGLRRVAYFWALRRYLDSTGKPNPTPEADQ